MADLGAMHTWGPTVSVAGVHILDHGMCIMHQVEEGRDGDCGMQTLVERQLRRVHGGEVETQGEDLEVDRRCEMAERSSVEQGQRAVVHSTDRQVARSCHCPLALEAIQHQAVRLRYKFA